MGFVCKMNCRHLRGKSKNMYHNGYGYCKICDKRMKEEDKINNRCFCCGCLLRYAPDNSMHYKTFVVKRIGGD